jgi:hypothetical protein
VNDFLTESEMVLRVLRLRFLRVLLVHMPPESSDDIVRWGPAAGASPSARRLFVAGDFAEPMSERGRACSSPR